jgi:hypothetical protein
MLEMLVACRAFSRAWAKTGNRMLASIAIIAMTTRSSISVNARDFVDFMRYSLERCFGFFLSAINIVVFIPPHEIERKGRENFFSVAQATALTGTGRVFDIRGSTFPWEGKVGDLKRHRAACPSHSKVI